MGLERCKESWVRRKYPSLSLQKRFADPFPNVLKPIAESNLSQNKCDSRLNFLQQNIIPGIKGRKSLIGHLGCVNALAFGPSGSGTLISGGDDRRVLVWKSPQFEDNDRTRPFPLPGEHDSNIFCVDFNGKNETKIFSGGNDERVLVHDTSAGGRTQDIFLHEAAVYGIDGHPTNGDIFVTACADGRVQMFDLRQNPNELVDPVLVAVASRPFRPFLGVQFNPCEPRLLITANQKEGACLWDLRQPRKTVLEYGSVELGPHNGPRWHGDAAERCMSVRFNSTGTRIAALGRRMPPVVYELSSPKPFAEFDSPGYYNSCTMKSICFGGLDDNFILSGSDDFNLYAWRIPDESPEPSEETILVNRASVVLRGHRSIVNQVRYNHPDGTIASSGIEKCIRLWSPFNMPTREQIAGRKDCEVSEDSLININPESIDNSTDSPNDRTISTRSNYLRLVQESHSVLDNDTTTEENPRMLAFFDRLVQREMEDDRFSSSSSSDGDGPGGTYRRPTSPSSNSVVSHVSDLTESESEVERNNADATREVVENPLNAYSSSSNNTTAIGRFIANFTGSSPPINDMVPSNENISDRNRTSNDLYQSITPVAQDGGSSSEAEQNMEEQSLTISNLIAKKRQRLNSRHLKKLKRSKKIYGDASGKMSAARLAYQSLQYQQKLKRARKMVSLESSSSSSSYEASESDSDNEANRSPNQKQIVDSNLKHTEKQPSSFGSGVIQSNCDNPSDKSSSKGKNCSLSVPNKVTKDDNKMRESILRALKEYEEEENLEDTSGLDGKDNTWHPKTKSRLSKNYNMVAETSSPDIVSLKITCNETEDELSEKTDKKVFLSSSLKNNIFDNVQNSSLYTSAASSTNFCDNKQSSNSGDRSEKNVSCDESDSTMEKLENVERVQFKKNNGLGKGKRCYRKRKLSED